MIARALFVAAALLATAGTAHARDPGGPIGMTRNLALHVQLGGVDNEVLADSESPGGYTSSGSANFFRIRGGGYLDQTHTGHLIGVEATMGFGWLDKDAFTIPGDEMNMQPPRELTNTWGRLFLDFDLTMLVDVIHIQDNRWLPPSKLAFIGGFGLSTDFAYFYIGGRAAGKLGGLQGEVEYQHRWGESHSAPNQREERIHAFLYYRSFGLGIESWKGYSEDYRGFAASDRVFRGGYSMTTINLMWVR